MAWVRRRVLVDVAREEDLRPEKVGREKEGREDDCWGVGRGVGRVRMAWEMVRDEEAAMAPFL